MFNGELEKGEEAEAWVSRMKKYFHIYNYSDRLKARMEIYNLMVKQTSCGKILRKLRT